MPSPPDPPAASSSPGDARPGARVVPAGWQRNALFFLATVASCFYTYYRMSPPWVAARHAAEYTAALLAILVSHELGHYIAARIHKVDASLPYFLPLPVVSPFGTLGAVIRMRAVIPTRRALLDIGASGPLAGMAVAIPLYAWGLRTSAVVSVDSSADAGIQLGDSLLSRLLDRLFAAPVPDGMDIALSPVAFAAWAGMFVTMLNLLPAGQLDGGHVAYALFGPRQDRVARWAHRSVLAFFFVSLGSYVARDLSAGLRLWHLGRDVDDAIFWLVYFEVLAVLGSVSSTGDRGTLSPTTRGVATLGLALLAGFARDETSPLLWGSWFVGLGLLLVMELRWGALRPDSGLVDHPPTGAQRLGRGRVAVAIVTLALFALLFMPTPMAM